MTMMLNPEAIDLASLRQLWAGAEARLSDGAMQRVDHALRHAPNVSNVRAIV